ncbi:MAG: thiamine phosphate synthase [Planctomycetota bacterium]
MKPETLRILDASINRASEGLRVVEDYARFVLGDAHLTGVAKGLRHRLAETAKAVPAADRHAMRETQQDVGATITTETETQRGDAWHVCAASLKRVEQSLRSLEEFGKLGDGAFASGCESLRYQTYTLEKALDTTRTSRERLDPARLCVLVGGLPSGDAFVALANELVEAGVGMIQLREKKLEGRDLAARARALVAATRGTGTLAIINDRPDIAAAAGADGVHLGQTDLPVHDARSLVGPRAIIGVSTHSIDQARRAVLDGANYLGAGPTFPSTTKSFDDFPGLDYLRQVSAEVSLPTFAIGGVNAENLTSVLETGATRIAVSGAMSSADRPSNAARRLLERLGSATAAT